MLYKIERSEVYFCNSFNLSQVDSWNDIKNHKTSYLLMKNPSIRLLRYPGFIFSSEQDSDFYYKDFYSKVEEVFTPPRGNLSKDSEYAFIGIKPGSYFAHLSQHENCWLLGPSSEMLNRLLVKNQIYPYWTNVYRSYKDEENKDVSLIIQEIETIRKIAPKITLVFMGSYNEYNQIIEKTGETNFIKIWHPSYLLRSYTEDKFEKWSQQLRRN